MNKIYIIYYAKKRKSKRAGTKSGLRLVKPSRSDRILVPGLRRRHIHTQSRPQRNNPYRNTDKTFMRGTLIEDRYMAPIRSSLRAIRGNLTDEDLHILPQRARLAKSFKKVDYVNQIL